MMGLLRLFGMSTSGILPLFSVAGGVILIGAGRLPVWLAGVLAATVFMAGTLMLGWFHMAPDYRLGFVSAKVEVSPDHALLRLASPLADASQAVVAPFEIMLDREIQVGDWMLARGESKITPSGRTVFEVKDLASFSPILPAPIKLATSHHIPRFKGEIYIAAAVAIILFGWGIANLATAVAVASAAAVLVWHGAAIARFNTLILLPEGIHLAVSVFAAMIGFRLAFTSPRFLREGLGRVLASTCLVTAMPFINNTFGWPVWFGYVLVALSVFAVVLTPILLAAWLTVLALEPKTMLANLAILIIVAVVGIAVQSLRHTKDPRVPVVTSARGLRPGETTGRIPLESLVKP